MDPADDRYPRPNLGDLEVRENLQRRTGFLRGRVRDVLPLDSRRSSRHPFSMRWWLCVLVCASACSWTFDDNAPDIPLLGQPPSLSSLQ
jgi:hypothetical protein